MFPAPRCVDCPARTRGAFHCLDDATAKAITLERTSRYYEAHEPVFYEGNPSLAVYCVASGELKLWHANGHGEVQVLGTRTTGDLMGCRAVLAGMPYTLTAQPLRRSLVCTIPRAVFLEAVRNNGRLAFGLLQRMAASTIEVELALAARAQDTVSQRAARFLLRIASPSECSAGALPVVQNALSRVEMAHLVGTSPETLSRTLHDWALRGLVRLDRTSIELLDPDALRRIAR